MNVTTDQLLPIYQLSIKTFSQKSITQSQLDQERFYYSRSRFCIIFQDMQLKKNNNSILHQLGIVLWSWKLCNNCLSGSPCTDETWPARGAGRRRRGRRGD